MGEAKSNVIELGERVKLTNGQLDTLARQGHLRALLDSDRIPVKMAWRLSKLSRAMEAASKAYNETRMKIVEKYVVRDEKNRPVIENANFKIQDEFKDVFGGEIVELLNCEADIDLLKPIIELDSIPDGVLSSNALVMLSLLVDFRE